MLGRVPAPIRPVAAALAALALILSACGDEEPAPAPVVQQQQQQAAAEVPDQQQAEERQQPEPQEQSPQAQEEPSEPEQQQQQQEQGQEQEQEQERPIPPLFTYLPPDATETPERIPIIRDLGSPPAFSSLEWRTLWGIRIIEFEELRSGCPWRDCIPSIEDPRFETIEEALATSAAAIPIVHVELNGDARGYPLDVLTRHEIVNDVIGGEPVAVTFCPLCNTAIAFRRSVGGEVLEFGVSGLLRNSDLVMYDRATHSLWQQATGRALVGAYVGARLEKLPAAIISFGQFAEEFPDGLVLSRGGRPYGENPYGGYDDEDRRPFLFAGEIDPRLPGTRRVVALETTDPATGAAEYIAYPWPLLAERRAINDTRGGLPIAVLWTSGTNTALGARSIAQAEDIGAAAVFNTLIGDIALFLEPNPEDDRTFIDNASGSVWNIFGRAISGPFEGTQLEPLVHADYFWFAWAAFHPQTEVYGSGGADG